MAAFGDSYPGANQPAWWYTHTGTTATTNPVFVYPSVAVAEPKPKRRTNLDWLRERIDEICALAPLEGLS
jgi:hypothetical protein